MTSEKKLRKIYWLCHSASTRHAQIVKLLWTKGIDAVVVSNLDSLLKELAKQRVAIIIIGDEGPTAKVDAAIVKLSSLPETQGVRFLLSVSGASAHTPMVAACCGFRDILPLDMQDELWWDRFSFATVKNAQSLTQPVPQIAYPQMADVALPGRIVWIGESRLLFEAKFKPPVGASLTISGKFPQTLGLKRLTIHVEECRRSNLLYRFSDAVVARWSVAATHRPAVMALLQKMRLSDFGPKIRIFAAVQDPNHRQQINRQLDPLRFEVNIALQKQSIVDEPRFFSPNLVIIEDKFCIGEERERFQKMLEALVPEVPIVILGQEQLVAQLQAQFKDRKIIASPGLQERLAETVSTKWLPDLAKQRQQTDRDAVNIHSDHPFSLTEVHFSARLVRMHPRFAQVAVPFAVGNYGLCRIESPELKRAMGYGPYAKITNCHHDAQEYNNLNQPYILDAHFCDVPLTAQQAVAQQLIALVSDRLTIADDSEQSQALEMTPSVVASQEQGAQRNEGAVAAILPPPKSIQKERIEEVSTKKFDPTAWIVGSIEGAVNLLQNKTFRMLVAYFGISASIVYAFYLFATLVAPNWHKSGGAYTDSLKKFAPSRFEETSTSQDEAH